MRQKHYVVTLSASVLADTTVAVLADSEEKAARLALEGADYDMEKWLNYYECDPFVEPTACDVSPATGRDIEYADQQHLLDGRSTDQ
jgi:hypothetical protein